MEVTPQKLNEPNKTFEKRVRRVFLQNNYLSSLHDSWGLLFPNIRSLALDNNELLRLPTTFVFMHHLTFLNISHNDFSKEGFPQVICELKNLRTLWANGIRVADIPKEIIELTKLEVLGLRHNEIVELPLEIWELKSLVRLSLSDNRIAEIPGRISNLTTLVHLNLDDNFISKLPCQEIFVKLVELRYLSLNNNFLNVTSQVMQLLRKVTKLRWCQLDGNPMSSPPAQQYKNGKFKPIVTEPIVPPALDLEIESSSSSDNSDQSTCFEESDRAKTNSIPIVATEIGQINFGFGLLSGDLSGKGAICVSLPIFSDMTSLPNRTDEMEQTAVIMSDHLGHETNSTPTVLSNRPDRSESRVRNWLMSTQEDLDLDDFNGNGDRAVVVSNDVEEESHESEYIETETTSFPESIGSLLDDEVNRTLIDLDTSDLEHSPRSSEIDDLDRASSHSSFNSDYDEWTIDVRDINLIVPRII